MDKFLLVYATHLDISIEILSKGIERIIMFHRVKERERFRGILNRESISFRPGKKRNVNETCMQNVWIEKCSEGKQRLTRKT